MDIGFSVGGYNIKGWMVAVALPVLSAVSGAVYWSYDTLNRFNAVETGLSDNKGATSELDEKLGALTAATTATDNNLKSRLQTLEQAVEDNNVRGLNTQLASISTQMNTILEQQKLLLDLRSQVEKSSGITDGIDDKIKVLDQEIEDIWKAYDSLVDNPL